MENKEFVWKGLIVALIVGIFALSVCICARNIIKVNDDREIERFELVVDSLTNEVRMSKSRMDSVIQLYDSKTDSILKNNEKLTRRVNYLQRQIDDINADLDEFD